jgi:hypothetical protein
MLDTHTKVTDTLTLITSIEFDIQSRIQDKSILVEQLRTIDFSNITDNLKYIVDKV